MWCSSQKVLRTLHRFNYICNRFGNEASSVGEKLTSRLTSPTHI